MFKRMMKVALVMIVMGMMIGTFGHFEETVNYRKETVAETIFNERWCMAKNDVDQIMVNKVYTATDGTLRMSYTATFKDGNKIDDDVRIEDVIIQTRE